MSERDDRAAGRCRARDLGLSFGRLAPGTWNAITDVPGIKVGHTTLIVGDGPLVVGRGPVRTGVTVILPHEGDLGSDPLFAGSHVLNGNGEMTGLPWVEESGML
ncbi:MAG: family peptidase, partial [Chloroflexi bacterium]|nr:family peptidase [Chloroflexota bacterium]